MFTIQNTKQIINSLLYRCMLFLIAYFTLCQQLVLNNITTRYIINNKNDIGNTSIHVKFISII